MDKVFKLMTHNERPWWLLGLKSERGTLRSSIMKEQLWMSCNQGLCGIFGEHKTKLNTPSCSLKDLMLLHWAIGRAKYTLSSPFFPFFFCHKSMKNPETGCHPLSVLDSLVPSDYISFGFFVFLLISTVLLLLKLLTRKKRAGHAHKQFPDPTVFLFSCWVNSGGLPAAILFALLACAVAAERQRNKQHGSASVVGQGWGIRNEGDPVSERFPHPAARHRRERFLSITRGVFHIIPQKTTAAQSRHLLDKHSAVVEPNGILRLAQSCL